MREFSIFGRPVRVKLLLNCHTVAGAANVSPAYTPPSLLVRYTNRHFGHQMRNMKRLTIAETRSVDLYDDMSGAEIDCMCLARFVDRKRPKNARLAFI